MPIYRKHGKPEYFYDFRMGGRRFSGPTGTSNRRQAEGILKEKKRRVREELKNAAKFTNAGPMTLEIAASRFWHEHAQHLANADNYKRFLGWHIHHFGKNVTLDRMTDSMIAVMVAKRRGEGVANATVNRSATVPLRSLMSRAKKVWKVPVAEIDWQQHMLKESQERVREASRDEEQKLMSAIRGDYAPALRFAILTGCRRMEIVDLTWQRIDFFGRTITVVGKGDKARVLPMTEAVHDLLWPLQGNHKTAVFTYVVQRTRKHVGLVRGERRPITKEGFKTAWRRTLGRAEVENFRFHDTRHTAATRTLRAGNLKIVQQMLGHSDLATTGKYAHSMVEDMRAAMEAAMRIEMSMDTSEKITKNLSGTKKSA